MVVDLIGLYGLKGPYCTLTTTNWFLQALSVIPRGSWGDVARRFTMIRWAAALPSPLTSRRRLTPPPPRVSGIRSGQFDEENPFVQNSSVLLVQADEGVSVLVVDRIGDIYRSLPRRANVIVTTVGARHKCQQVDRSNLISDRSYGEVSVMEMNIIQFWKLSRSVQSDQRSELRLLNLTLDLSAAPPLLSQAAAAAAAVRRRKFVSGQFDEEKPSAQISSRLLVQGDEGVSYPVMDRIGDIYRNLPRRADVIVTTVGARHKCQQGLVLTTEINNVQTSGS
ncbi:hypothetical protein F511_08071 [Dorcoceras hygrometricum]|uniref:Uncharacterized protein n=1 Tax=Dorcoceras hygrometricum TaxID=472368 RepID=A0A2Z7CUN5_9LAMI|nr:hypothetical protein F511_08071 [Dorcoceras hygrometricum]